MARVHEPIILLGAPRSGTTLLQSLLDRHADVAASVEPRLVWRYGNDRRSDQLRPEHATASVADHLHGRFAALLRDQGATRLVEKTPANSVRPRFVEAVFPDARYVHITRNGWGAVPSMRTFWARRGTGFDAKQLRKVKRRLREVSLSQLRYYLPELGRRTYARWSSHVPLYGPHLAGLQAAADELGVLEAAAMQWRVCVDQTSTFGRNLPPNRYLEVKLETLDADVMAGMLEFCGLAPSGAVLDGFREHYRLDSARRQSSLTDDERAIVAPYVMPANSWLGYPEAGAEDVRPPSRAAGLGLP